MSLALPVPATGGPTIGNDAGWLLSFYKDGKLDGEPAWECGRDMYDATIKAVLPSGLEGGSYTFTIEGIRDDDYKKIAQGKEDSPSVVKLYLFWRDTNSSVAGYLANVTGLTGAFGGAKAGGVPGALVAVLTIDAVSRKAGARRYEAKITARERMFDVMQLTRLKSAITGETVKAALEKLAKSTPRLSADQIVFHETPLKSAKGAPPPALKGAFAAGKTYQANLSDLHKTLEERSGLYGRGLFLIRDGILHVGKRPVPLGGEPGQAKQGEAKKLTVENGFIDIAPGEKAIRDPNADPNGKPLPTRRQFRITLKGRPDLKPGDVVEFDLPDEDAKTGSPSILGAIAAAIAGPLLPVLGGGFKNPGMGYVSGVEHNLGRTTGFSTVITVVELDCAGDVWDTYSPSPSDEKGKEPKGGSPEAEAAKAVKQAATDAAGAKAQPEVGEVRKFNAKGTSEPPAQTQSLWLGLKQDGGAAQSRRMPIERPGANQLFGVPYATPFAWGNCGLILPRYPGTRVLAVHRAGRADDPIDVGALWETPNAPEANPGDWWLILPVGVRDAESIEGDNPPKNYAQTATNDLIDGDGNRIIEVGELTIRVGKSVPSGPGERPKRGNVEIQGGQGATIFIDENGAVTIEATSIKFKASGNIDFEAANVNVKVSGKMNVE